MKIQEMPCFVQDSRYKTFVRTRKPLKSGSIILKSGDSMEWSGVDCELTYSITRRSLLVHSPHLDVNLTADNILEIAYSKGRFVFG